MARLSITLFLFFLLSCSRSNSNSENVKKVAGNVAMADASIIPLTKNAADTLTWLESIDKANAKTIARDDSNNIQKATIFKDNGLMKLTANMRLDYRIFGYDKPDNKSKKMILLSIFTSDVEENPFKCPFGAYYQTGDMPEMKLIYVATEGDFVKVNIVKKDTIEGTVFFEKKWIRFIK